MCLAVWDAHIGIQDSCHGAQTDGETTTVDCAECFWWGKVVLFLCVFSLPSSFLSTTTSSSLLSPIISILSIPSFCPVPLSLLLPSLPVPALCSSANLNAIVLQQQSNLNVVQMLWQTKAGYKSLSAEWELNYPAWVSCWHTHIERKSERGREGAQVSSELNQPFCLSISYPGSQ